MYEKSSSVTFGGYCLLPKGDNRGVLLPQKAERHEPIVTAAKKRKRMVLARAARGIWSRWMTSPIAVSCDCNGGMMALVM
jgi:hypothetical protein